MDGKRVELDSTFVPEKCQKRCDDGMSKIHDDIIIKILSCLPLKEAVRTSVLSSRWVNLWKHRPRLNFDLDSALKSKIAESQELKGRKLRRFVKEERRKYVDWVNTVLQSHKAPTLEEFSVCFELGRSHQNEITRWLEFAFAKNVRRLELGLSIGFHVARPSGNCSFPEELLTRIDFKSLRELSLKHINVTGEAIEFFLLKCPFLEKLVVLGTGKISNLQVCGESLMLKHLELDNCYGIKSVIVSAPNLSSLTVPIFKGLSLKNVPMLVEVSVTFINFYSIKYLFPALACCISRLEILHLKLRYAKKNVEDSESLVHHKFPEMPKLKKLLIHYWDTGDESLIGLTSLIRASPNLHEFGLELIWQDLSRSDREIKSSMKLFHHQSLQVFKFCGYYGRVSDVELVMCISENCIALEKIIIDPRDQLPYLGQLLKSGLGGEHSARNYAKQQLEEKLPQHIDLVIL